MLGCSLSFVVNWDVGVGEILCLLVDSILRIHVASVHLTEVLQVSLHLTRVHSVEVCLFIFIEVYFLRDLE